MLTFDIVTLFPQLFESHLKELPFKKAIEKELVKINLHNLRDYANDKRGTVDDKPYGGGVGMILMIEPLYKVLKNIYGNSTEKIELSAKQKIIVLAPNGVTFKQKTAQNLTECEQITIICGRYEGIDGRINEICDTTSISIGDFVLSGGEIPALAVMESTIRLIPSVLEKPEAALLESFSTDTLEHPQYTRPEDFMGYKVPQTLLSGDHKKIEQWKREN